MPGISRRSFIAMIGGTAVPPYISRARGQRRPDVPTLLDHVLLGCSDLQHGIDFVEQRSGVRAAFGGVHPGRGTQNALVSLGERRYLEIIAPDPQQHVPEEQGKYSNWVEPRPIGWAAHPGDLEQFAARLRGAGIAFEGPQPGSRQRPDGKLLRWKTLHLKDGHGGLLPFFIEWGADSVHPSANAPKGCVLQRFEAATPEAEDLLHAASLLGLDLRVNMGNEPRLQVSIAGPRGEIQLSS